MARPMTPITLSIIKVLESNPAITYNEAVDQGLVNPTDISVARFNVTKHNFSHGKIVALNGGTPATPKVKKVAVPKAKTPAVPAVPAKRSGRPAKLVAVSNVGDLTAAMKAVADAGGIAKAQALIAKANALQAALDTVTTTQATLAKIA